ncbi:helicase SNF2 [Variovorax sp. dw_308]|uniref:helicase SNF2 n=1 Tax=Variovorax sp. dw_308 TaxID=2721546 RepID=UPI001C47E246|nr:helicase SNF2 [Variovorax sp. dw_308]
MNTSKIIVVAALSMLAATSVQSETYQGVHIASSKISRAEVASQAVVAAHNLNPYSEGTSATAAPALLASTDRSLVRQQAVLASHSADPFAEGGSSGVTKATARSTDRSAVRIGARAAALGFYPGQ